jgi:predicted nucleic-acid-binding protein
MNNPIQDTIKKAKAEAFAELLAKENPCILELLIMPLNQQIRELAKNDREISVAMNLMVEFINVLDPFPRVSQEAVENVVRRLKANPVYLCKAEVEIAANSTKEEVEAWACQVVTNEIKVNIALSGNDELIQALARFYWAVFACLRQAASK